MTVIVDDYPEFKAIRARFYRLGKVRQVSILGDMGYSVDLGRMDNAAKKEIMIRIAFEGRLEELAERISAKELEKEGEEEVKSRSERCRRELWDGFQANSRNPEEDGERQDATTQQDGDTDAGV